MRSMRLAVLVSDAGLHRGLRLDDTGYAAALDSRTAAAINQWLNISQDDGTYAALSQKYLGAVIGP